MFGNDPGLVADAFARPPATRDRFDRIRFAVPDRRPATPSHTVLARVFSGTASERGRVS